MHIATNFQPKNYDDLKTYCQGCKECDIRNNVKQVVFGVGPIKPDYMIIGEAPGFNEDQDGEPFTGRAGKKLMQLILDIWGRTRNDIYFTNTLKCRPPENRDPTEDEFYNCLPWLTHQIREVDPSVILTVGKFATMTLTKKFNSGMVMGRERGKMQSATLESKSYSYIPTWHPAYILRNPPKESELIEDMKMARLVVESDSSQTCNTKEISIW